MYPWLFLWAPQLQLPFSGDVAQRIEPRTQWFFDGIDSTSGDPVIERKAFDVASYGRQLGLLTELLLDMAAQTPPRTRAGREARQRLQKIQAEIEANNFENLTLTGTAANLLRDAQGRAVEAFEPGMILYRRGMGSVEVVNPSGGGSHAAFARRALEAASVGAGLTYDQVSGDLTQANYSSLRAGKIEFRRLCEQVQ